MEATVPCQVVLQEVSCSVKVEGKEDPHDRAESLQMASLSVRYHSPGRTPLIGGRT